MDTKSIAKIEKLWQKKIVEICVDISHDYLGNSKTSARKEILKHPRKDVVCAAILLLFLHKETDTPRANTMRSLI